MFNYTRNLQLAASDMARRLSLKAGAGVIIALGLGFLLAALWTFLAHNLKWGSLNASLAIGGVFVVIGLIVLMLGSRQRHRMPSPDELKSEMQEHLSLATDAVLDRVSDRAERALDSAQHRVEGAIDLAHTTANNVMRGAEQKVCSLVDTVSFGANRFAGKAEARAQQAGHQARDFAEEKLGLTPERLESASTRISEGAQRVKSSNLAAVAPVIGAFAVGMTLASRLRERWRDEEDDDSYTS